MHDAADVSTVARRAFCETFTHYEPCALSEFLEAHCSAEAFTQALQSPRITLLLAYMEGELVGYAKFGASRLPGLTAEFELHQLYVLRAWHGRKIGAKLLEAVLHDGQRRSAKNMYLGVWEHNKNAQEFYAHYGFTKVGEYDYLPIGEIIDHEWIMVKSLES